MKEKQNRSLTYWTSEDEDRLAALYERERKDIREIVSDFHGKYTRNAIIGKIFRLRIKGKITRTGAKIKSNKKKVAVFPPVTLPKKLSKSIEPLLPKRKSDKKVRLEDLTKDTCRYPMWGEKTDSKDSDKTYCGKQVIGIGSSPYCEEHTTLCYTVHPKVSNSTRTRKHGAVRAPAPWAHHK